MKINGSEIGGSYYHDVLTLTCKGKQFKVTTLEIWEWLAQKAAQHRVGRTLPNESRQPSWCDDGLDDAVIGSLP